MNREHQPCGMCHRFPPASRKDEAVERTGHCTGWDKPVLSTDGPCVLFLERGTWQTRQGEKAVSRDQLPRDRRAGATRPRPANETTSRASAATPAVAGTTT